MADFIFGDERKSLTNRLHMFFYLLKFLSFLTSLLSIIGQEIADFSIFQEKALNPLYLRYYSAHILTNLKYC